MVGQKTINALIKPTFYSQFVGGDSEEDFLKVMQKRREQNLRLMLLPLYEDELDETDTRLVTFTTVRYPCRVIALPNQLQSSAPVINISGL